MICSTSVSPLQLYEFIPWVMDCVPGPKEKTFCGTERVRSFIQQEIRSHEEIGRTDEPENFIDFYLAQMAKVSVCAVCDYSSYGVPKHRWGIWDATVIIESL